MKKGQCYRTDPSKERMIFQSKITVSELSRNGKNHKWDKCHCSKCNRSMWGHGFVGRYFSAFAEAIYLKRYRCPECRTVTTARPEGHWPCIRSSILVIHQALISRITVGAWPSGFPRQRGGHWIRRFVNFAKMSCQTNLLLFLNVCLEKELGFFA